VNRSSVNVFITTMNSSVAEASTCTIKYFNEASMLYMCLLLDITIRVLHPDPAHKLSANLYDIYNSCVYNEELLDGQRNCL